MKRKQIELPIHSLEILRYQKSLIGLEMNDCADDLEKGYGELKHSLTADNIIETISGNDGFQSDFMKYILPFALKYRHFITDIKVFNKFNPMNGKKSKLMMLAALIGSAVAFRVFSKKSSTID